MSRTLVCGDIHGGYKALKQCLQRCNFDNEQDTLIQLGDVVDGWSEVYEAVEELLDIKNLVALHGNHDSWFLDFLQDLKHPAGWSQGGLSTLTSYMKYTSKEEKIIRPTMKGYVSNLLSSDIPYSHTNFFLNQNDYYIDDKNRFFVHAGFDRKKSVKEETNRHIFYWDRQFWNQALSFEATIRGSNAQNLRMKTADNFLEIYIGHTTTMNWGKDVPMKAGNVWNLDTGCGWKGKLTIMDIDTKEYWQSDPTSELYPEEKGR